MVDQTVSIVGCGWLGLPLAEKLIGEGYKIKGSTTSPAKLEMLKNKGIDPYLVHFSAETRPEISGLLLCDVLIINIPPGSKKENGAQNYRCMADHFLANIPQSGIKTIILVSSTSVYRDTNTRVSESDLPEPETRAGRLLLEVEEQFLGIKNKKVCVVRPCGLVGPDRHPGRFFKNKSHIPNGLAPVNLIHRDDVIGIILKLIADKQAHGVYNCCSVNHPGKQDFYGLAAKFAGNEPPQFIPESKSWKIVSSVHVAEELNYDFKYPDLLDWLKNEEISG